MSVQSMNKIYRPRFTRYTITPSYSSLFSQGASCLETPPRLVLYHTRSLLSFLPNQLFCSCLQNDIRGVSVIRFAARCFDSDDSSGCAPAARLRTSHCHR